MASSPASTATLVAESIDCDIDPLTGIDEEVDPNDEFDRAWAEQYNEYTRRVFRDNEDEPMEDEDFVLDEIYTRPSDGEGLSPLMLAAGHPDPRVLRAALRKEDLFLPPNSERVQSPRPRLPLSFAGMSPIRPSEFWPNAFRCSQSEIGITNPLLEAIRAKVPENAELLLDLNANPNGPPLWVMENYSAFFLRFRPIIPEGSDCCGDVASRQALLGRMDLPQLSNLTWEEVEDRFWDGMAPFWCEQDFVPADFYLGGEAMPAIVEAARCGSIDIFDQLFNAGADTSFWMTPQFFIPAQLTESSLSVSSPIHAALQARDLEMLNHLLSLGFDPNAMPLSNPTRCVTPLMATITQHEDFDFTAFDTLARCPNINLELRTPVYGVHILHFAVACLNLRMLEHIAKYTPLHRAGVTALGHTLLHIACMPANALEVQRHSQLIYNSIHETRDLHARNDPFASRPQPPPQMHFINYRQTNFQDQIEVVKFLWANGVHDLRKQDVHGNTALHYLCGYRYPNQELLTWLLEQRGVKTLLEKSTNMYGSTPKELLDSGKDVGDETSKPWFKRTRREERVKRKQEIWKGLLGDEAMRDLL